MFRKTAWLVENESDGTLLALVPAGASTVGGPEHYESDCAPFTVELPSFYLALHPVTNAQYKRFLEASGRPPPRCYRASLPGEELWQDGAYPPGEDDHPVVGVRWSDAQAYCEWAGVRLPRELEWEKAARGDDGRAFPWGSQWDAARCRNDDTRRDALTTSVWDHGDGCGYWGHYQLSGNVWEWCADAYSRHDYRRYREGDLSLREDGRERVVRGGSWFNLTAENFLASFRFHLAPGEAERHYGFRVARSV